MTADPALVQALGLEDALEVADGVVEPDVLAVPAVAAGLDLLPTWALGQKAAANREVSAVMRQRLAAGEAVARMYREPGWSAKPRCRGAGRSAEANGENRPGS